MSDHRTLAIEQMIGPIASVAGSADLCVNVAVAGDEARWAQYVGGQINIACFSPAFPADDVVAIGEAEVVGFEPGLYLTVIAPSQAPGDVAAWIYDWFQQALGAGDDFTLHIDVEDLGPSDWP